MVYSFKEDRMKDKIRKEPKKLKQQRDKLLRKHPELKSIEEVDIPQWMEERSARIIKCFQKRKAE